MYFCAVPFPENYWHQKHSGSAFQVCRCAIMMRMMLLRKRRALVESLENRLHKTLAKIPTSSAAGEAVDRGQFHSMVITAAWVVGGLGVVTLGLIAGRELRGRYQFKRRTPYDYYAHSGDRSRDLDYSVGI